MAWWTGSCIVIGAGIVEEIEVKAEYMGGLVDRILYSNRSRYSRGDRGEGGIHGWLGGQDLEVPMIFIVSFGRVQKGSNTCNIWWGWKNKKPSARRSKIALLCC